MQSLIPFMEPYSPASTCYPGMSGRRFKRGQWPAVRFLERAGELASRSGAFGEARNHLKSAIALAAAEDHGRLYEKLGDCAVRGDTARAAYREAFLQWRGETKRDPLIGARLLRKL